MQALFAFPESTSKNAPFLPKNGRIQGNTAKIAYKVAGLPIGILVNFLKRKLEWKRLQSNEEWLEEEAVDEPSMV
ncbi:MAG: hypothetical protein LLF94_06740 [Chlamydiales bacterium]|nr:hypothetical protein [Chlamydiales bacterium]